MIAALSLLFYINARIMVELTCLQTEHEADSLFIIDANWVFSSQKDENVQTYFPQFLISVSAWIIKFEFESPGQICEL